MEAELAPETTFDETRFVLGIYVILSVEKNPYYGTYKKLHH